MNTSDFITFKEGWYVNADNEGKAKFRNWLLTVLGTTVVSITFTKTNGQVRQMRCTTMPSYVNNVVSSSDSEFICKVWDVDANAWRSFYFDSITDLSFDL